MGCGDLKSVEIKNSTTVTKKDFFADIPQHDPIIAETIIPIPYGTLRQGIARGCNFIVDQRQIQPTLKQIQSHFQRQQTINKINKIQNLYQTIINSYCQHDIDKCASLIATFNKIYDSIDFLLIEQTQFQNKQAIIDKITKINQEHAQMIIFEKELNRGDWIFKSQSNGISISSRHEQNTVGVLVQSIIDVPVQIFLSVISQMELYNQFVPFVSASKQQKVLDRNHKIGYCIVNFPFLSKRQAFFQGVGYNRLNHNDTIFIYSRSLHNRLDLCQKLGYTPTPNKEFVQVQFKYLMVRYEPIDQKRGKVALAMNIDMQLNFLPMFILDKACQTFGEQFFLNIIEVSKNFKDSVWQKRIKVHPQTFNFFKSIINEYFAKKRSN